VTSLRH